MNGNANVFSSGASLGRRLGLFVAVAAVLALAIPEADAQRGNGSRGTGRAAQSSVSSSNRAATRPSAGTANRGNVNTGNANRSNVNTGNANRNNVNTGDMNRNNVNTGDVNRNNINTGDINIGNDVNIDIDPDYGYGARPCCGSGYYHPIAAGVVIGTVAVTTAAVMGSYYRSLPVGCTVVVKNGVSYHYCGSVYYQQTWSGNDVVYVVVKP